MDGRIADQLDANHHLKYTKLTESLILNNTLRNFLHKLDQMVMDSENNFEINILDSQMAPTERIKTSVVEEISKLEQTTTKKTDQSTMENRLIKDKVLNILEGIPPKTDAYNICKLFPSNESVRKQVQAINLDGRVRAYGFPSARAFGLLHKDTTTQMNALPLEIDYKYLLSLIVNTDSLLNDNYLDQFKEYMEKYKAAKPPTDMTMNNYSKHRLETIRHNVLANIEFFKGNNRGQTLESYSQEIAPVVKLLDQKEMDGIRKVITSTNPTASGNTDLTCIQKITKNCNLCKSFAKKTKEQKSNLEFRYKAYSLINIHKIIPLFNLQEVKKHHFEHHADKKASRSVCGHSYILTCITCLREGKHHDMFSCCLACARDHFSNFHADCIFFTMYKKLKIELIANNQVDQCLKHLESCLMVRCVLCGKINTSKSAKDNCEMTCYSRMCCGSFFWGQPLMMDLLDNTFLRTERKRLENDLLVECCQRFITKSNNETQKIHTIPESEVFPELTDEATQSFTTYINEHIEEYVWQAKNKIKNGGASKNNHERKPSRREVEIEKKESPATKKEGVAKRKKRGNKKEIQSEKKNRRVIYRTQEIRGKERKNEKRKRKPS